MSVSRNRVLVRRWDRTARATAAVLTFAVACSSESPSGMSPPPASTARLTVRVTTLGQQPLPAAYVRAVGTSTIDSAALGADGSARLTVPNRDTVDLMVGGTGASHYGARWLERFSRDTTIDIVLIPRLWTVQRGIHAGASRPIDLVRGVSSEVNDTHYLNRFAPGQRVVSAWPLSALPIAVGLDTTGGTPPWTTRDSVFFWTAVAELNREIGREVFRPVGALSSPRIDLVGVSIDPANPIPRGVLSSQCDAGQHLCNRRFGQVWMSRSFSFPGVFADQTRRTVKHELLHTLGFGHGCYWPSLMMLTSLSCLSVSELPATVTADDVAYIELIFELASALEMRPAAWSIDEALAATIGRGAGTIARPPFSHHAIP